MYFFFFNNSNCKGTFYLYPKKLNIIYTCKNKIPLVKYKNIYIDSGISRDKELKCLPFFRIYFSWMIIFSNFVPVIL